jgi:hypothetical protein
MSDCIQEVSNSSPGKDRMLQALHTFGMRSFMAIYSRKYKFDCTTIAREMKWSTITERNWQLTVYGTMEWSGVEFAADGQSASMSWWRVALWGPWLDVTCSLVGHIFAFSCRAPSLTRGLVCILQWTSLTGHNREGPITIYYCLIWEWAPFSSPLTNLKFTVEVI